MKKTLLAFSLISAVGMISNSAFAKPAADKASPESTVSARMIEQVLNSIESASIDLNIHSMSFKSTKDSKTEESKSEVKFNDVDVKGMILFGSDWSADILTPKASTPKNAQTEKIYPKIMAGAKSLVLGVELKKTEKSSMIRAEFFSGFNSKTQRWEPRPLVVNVSNQMNKSLMKVRIHSLTVELRPTPKNPKVQIVSGTCKSDKFLLDPVTGQSRLVEVACLIKGTQSENGYDIDASWENK